MITTGGQDPRERNPDTVTGAVCRTRRTSCRSHGAPAVVADPVPTPRKKDRVDRTVEKHRFKRSFLACRITFLRSLVTVLGC